MAQHYDLIGDIHGHADALEALLQKLGYQSHNGVYQHEQHKVIFLGDFIDRGSQQREVIDIVKPMIEQGFALSVMGNHEFNAICYATSGQDGQVLRKHTDKNTKQHQKFLDAYPSAVERNNIIDWFKTLPVYIETDGIRVIHASWNDDVLEEIAPLLNDKQCLVESAYEACSQKGNIAYDAIELLLKGPEVQLPSGVTFIDKDGTERDAARFKWWTPSHLAPEDRLHVGDSVTNGHKISDIEIDDSLKYCTSHPPLFVGHYWLSGDVSPLSKNSACLDYSVAKDGRLVAYQWRGERILCISHFEWCDD